MARVLLVVYDNESYIHWFPQGIASIAAVLRQAGHEVVIYNQDVHHYPDAHLTEKLDTEHFDIVGVGIIAGYYQYRRLLGLSNAINAAKNRPYYILGGHGPSPEPEYFLRKTGADAVVIGEGEETVLDLLEAQASHRSLETVPGVAFRDGDRVVVNNRRPLIADVDTVPLPAYDLFPINYYRLLRDPNCSVTDFVMPILTGRGCTFKCTFCYRMDEGFRPRSNEAIIEEIRFLQQNYGITYFGFSDELLMSSVQRTTSLCEDFLRSGLKFKWACNGRLNYASRELLELMKRSGCVFINYGIEAMDDQVLKKMHKGLTVKQIVRGVEETLKTGISPGLNIIFGNLGDNIETLHKGVEFLLRHDDGAQLRTIRPVTPYPGSELYYHAIKTGLLKDVEEFYERKHVNSDLVSVNLTDLTDQEFHRALLEANSRLIKN
ncbi:MAG: B12-binding domain-containing radical SAM protein, partial [Candidatus Marsarchaeota archaeon]|nr:B12-binding domain-containing radical SAM protein [Candidatus Marsarchaeota archaeon]